MGAVAFGGGAHPVGALSRKTRATYLTSLLS
jgi:hypothetical protein